MAPAAGLVSHMPERWVRSIQHPFLDQPGAAAMRSSSVKKAIQPFAILILAACADSTTGAGRPGSMTLSFTNRSAASTSSVAPVASAAPITVEGGGNTVVINQVRLVLGEIELNPVLVDVPLSGPATLDLGVLVPAGSYRELEFKIEKADGDGTVLDPANGTNALRIGQNIGFSFAAFGDDDRNGIQDRR
jgi:hypothetical protein